MLVLTRREDQKVLFPNLGIAVEVIAIQGNTVRLGIDAPREVRVVRSELDIFPDPPPPACESDETDGEFPALFEMRNSLNAANMAIYLAQNQMQQGLAERAEEALDHALACLRAVDETWSGLSESRTALPASSQPSEVRESRSAYQTGNAPPDTGVLLVGPDCPQRSRIAESLTQNRVTQLVVMKNDDQSAHQWLAETLDQPELMLVFALRNLAV